MSRFVPMDDRPVSTWTPEEIERDRRQQELYDEHIERLMNAADARLRGEHDHSVSLGKATERDKDVFSHGGIVRGKCVRCGERITETDQAEVAEGLVHQSCMKEGEEIA